MFTKSHKRTPSGRKRLDITLNVEQMTNEERLSRSLHSRRPSTIMEKPHLFEWFLVVGTEAKQTSPPLSPFVGNGGGGNGNNNSSSNNNSNNSNNTLHVPNAAPDTPPAPSPRAASPSFLSSFSKPPLMHSGSTSPRPTRPVFEKPKVLYQYPPDKPLGSINVQDFPFPSGVPITTQSQTASHSNLFSLLYTQTHLKEAEDSFVFMLTDEKKDVLYGVCTMKQSAVDRNTPDSIDVNDEDILSPSIDVGDKIQVAPKCYIVLTKYPFFPLHFNILNSVLNILHIQHLDQFQANLNRRFKKNPAISGSTSPRPTSPTPSQSPSPSPHVDVPTSTPVQPSQSSTQQPTVQITITPDPTSPGSPPPPVRPQPIKEVIEYFYYQNVPMPGETLRYEVPFLETTIQFRRGTLTDAKADVTSDYPDFLIEYGLFVTLQLLTHKTILIILNAMLLEKKIIFYSKSLKNLTSVIFSMVSLLKPFVYQSVLLPIIPDSLQDVINAPVPFIIGMITMPAADVDLSDLLLIDIDQNKIQTKMPPIILFPKWKELGNKIIEHQRDIKNSLENKKSLNYYANEVQEAFLSTFTETIRLHLNRLFENFSVHCIRDVSQLKHVSVFIPESFASVEYENEEEQDWILQFTKTQIFSVYQDKRLRQSDGDEEEEEVIVKTPPSATLSPHPSTPPVAISVASPVVVVGSSTTLAPNSQVPKSVEIDPLSAGVAVMTISQHATE
ncbi:hypothetical protein SAMD00019534_031920 [Acytostelium subglobosum LB1]|uniref:hypothetical protein n=1 Tax=Acytostelium subglobosum LB1 TaxID=1410327 RepID=UPI000644C2E4|nr:hypothetical protein SAMD00019534_031920 [Acytostelium subglobosum LB1]GAM20017.1 hypothetical protein SAMD00019534_031920 [Acytostelium subglobosum LB1]|eukprot:XP_012756779.1 hypothetical protein SAMD00019534_031920 [Acytostelium subglobosum LB1]